MLLSVGDDGQVRMWKTGIHGAWVEYAASGSVAKR